MKAKLFLQEGPGAGRWFPLDPSRQILLSVGRSADCNIVLGDHRSSRYHADFRWNGDHWEVVDRGSTNGTYVNGMQVHQPYDLRLGDRISSGETTLVVREWETPAPERSVPAHVQESAPAARRAADAAPLARASAGTLVAYWLAQALIAASVVSLASGAFLPWLQVTGSLSQDMEPLIKGITDIISSIVGPDFLFVTQKVSGLQGYGKLTLGIAVLALIVLVVDIFVYRKSVVPGIIYTIAGLLAVGAMAADLKNLYDVYNQVQTASLLFGIKLSDVVEVFDKFIKVEVSVLPGLYLTGAGLGLLLVGGLGRLAVALLERGGRTSKKL
jgi:pSer/pThr/pTyr-binding forkhead associated (FHA) protein